MGSFCTLMRLMRTPSRAYASTYFASTSAHASYCERRSFPPPFMRRLVFMNAGGLQGLANNCSCGFTASPHLMNGSSSCLSRLIVNDRKLESKGLTYE